MTYDFWEYGTENIKKQLSVKEEPIAVININYPFFSEKKEKQNNFVSKINKFYKHTAEKYADYVVRKYPSKALRVFNENGRIKLSFLMSFAVSYNTEDILSIFTDLSYFDGHTKKSVRFSQNWSCEHSAMLPPSFYFDTGKKSKKYLTSVISGIASENMKNRSFNYYADFEKLIRSGFDFDNFYFVPNGAAFFYNQGFLSEESELCVFVVSKEKMNTVLRK